MEPVTSKVVPKESPGRGGYDGVVLQWNAGLPEGFGGVYAEYI